MVFAQSVAKFSAILPPSRKDINECLTVLFTGPMKPTTEDYKRTPFLIRRSVVWDALCWLKNNHRDYKDVMMSHSNLLSYPEDSPTVAIFQFDFDSEPSVQNLPVYNISDKFECENGMSIMYVCGLTAQSMTEMTHKEQILIAVAHVKSERQIIGYRKASDSESIYHNLELFPGMFPWLFPYGFREFENSEMLKEVSCCTHVRYLLMFYDRCFQVDEFFLYLVFN